jgi:Asp-tRNA(Asn)/Glu-tRNA(Gln) amidotransferase A subunit family amidase
MSEQIQPITNDQITSATQLIGLDFTEAEQELMHEGLTKQREQYVQLRTVSIPNSVSPALLFDPRVANAPLGDVSRSNSTPTNEPAPPQKPADLGALAFAPVTQLSQLLRLRQISSVELTTMYLERLKRYDPALRCVVTLTEDLAMEQARRADAEIAVGNYRGPLHGVPWGAKDLLATRGIRTTWGAPPYRDQIIDMDATVVQRLEAAGAVLVAKLTLGELAWGDVWSDAQTKCPWDLNLGASGSSAGPGAATAAGLVGFSIGSETWGSIVSPSTRNGVSGLRPTFGRISRHGAMALSWSMDKLGPMCRSVADCALVFEAIYGPDGLDPTVVDQPFRWQPGMGLNGLRIGYVETAFEQDEPHKSIDNQTLDVLRSLGAGLIPITLPDYPVEALSMILSAEAAAAFDELTRTDGDELLVRQEQNAWPNVFRTARLIPAVEYIQANRLRTLVMQSMAQLMSTIDVYVAPSFGGNNLLLTNMTGHPSVVVPNGYTDEGHPTSISFTGRLYGEGDVLAVAETYQNATTFHLRYPPMNF